MDLRISDAERERVAIFLRDRCLEGRLDSEELDERLTAALSARTRGQLTELVADLPGGAAALPPEHTGLAPPPPASTPARRNRAVPILAVLAVVFLAVPLLVSKELVLLAGVAAVALAVLCVILLTALAPWLAVGAGAVWAVRRLQERGRAGAQQRELGS